MTEVFKNMKNKNRVVIIVSHQERILQLADEILLLENGGISSFSEYEKFVKVSQNNKSRKIWARKGMQNEALQETEKSAQTTGILGEENRAL